MYSMEDARGGEPPGSGGPGWSEADTDSSISVRFTQVAAARAQHPAIAGSSCPLTYAELDRLADRFARSFPASAAPEPQAPAVPAPQARAALLMSHDGALLAATLAALRSGRAVVTLNAGDPPARLGQIRTAVEPDLVITDEAHLEQARAAGFAESQLVLAPGAGASDLGAADHGPPPGPDQLAFLICTSGSTGRPKVVMQTHRNMLHNVLRYTNGLGIQAADRVAWLASPSGGQGLATAWATLLNGGTLCPFPIMDRGVTGLAQWLEAQRITVFDTLPSVLRNFARTLTAEHRIAGIRLVRLASEPGLREDFEAYRRHFPADSRLASVLGSSEAGIIAQTLLSPESDPPDGRLPVGRIAEGVQVSLLDESRQAVAAGEAGEIMVGGRYLSPGYWRDERLTGDRFAKVGDARWLRTGDLGRLGSDDDLTVIGRTDSQVKIRGNRLQLEEVEAALAALDDVAGAAVLARENERGHVRLIAYVTSRNGVELVPARLRRSLRAVLASHAIPTAFVLLEDLPLNPNGKVDRTRLAELDPVLAPKVPGRSAQTETEELLIAIWAEAFERDVIDPDEEFLELGGDSLIAAVIAAAVHELFGVELSLREFTSDPTAATLAASIDARRHDPGAEGAEGSPPAGADEAEPPLVHHERDGPAPLSFAQEGLWPSVKEKGAGFNLAVPFRIRGPLDVEVLRASLQQLVHRHEILRTTFPERDGQPFALVGPALALDLPVDDLRGEPDPRAAARELVGREARRPYDVAAAPPWSLRVMRLGEVEYQLLQVSHHLVCDALSWKIFFDELAVLYEARLAGRAAPLPAQPALQYADYAIWERSCVRPGSDRYERDISWWERAFASSPPQLELPFAKIAAEGAAPSSDGVIDWGLEPDRARALDRIGRESGATHFMTRLAVFAALIGLETGVDDIVLATYSTTRRRAALQQMLGPMMDRTLLRLRFSPRRSLRGWLADVRSVVLDTTAHASIPDRELWAELRRRGIRRPAVRTRFEALYRLAPMRFGGLEIEPLQRHNVKPWAFTLGIDRRYEASRCRAVFDPGEYDAAGVQRFLDALQALFGAACAEPDRPLSEVHRAMTLGARGLGRMSGPPRIQEPRMDSVDYVTSVVDGLSTTSAQRGRELARMIHDHDARDALVVGYLRGAASCYIAAALKQRGRGHVVTVGRADKIAFTPSIEQLLARLSLSEHATVFFEYGGYNWRLGQLLGQRPRPEFDLVLFNGMHSWDADGFAFLLAEQLTSPGGYLVFASLNWTIAASPNLSEQTRNLPEDLRNAQQLRLVAERLIKPHPNIAEYWEDGSWGFARKRDGAARLDDQTRDAALAVMQERAGPLRQRALRSWQAGRHDSLVGLHPLTGARPKIDPWDAGRDRPANA